MKNKLISQINELKKKKDAIILVHNYQNKDIYEVADFIGDSFELSKKAAETKNKIIVFCGVSFMAETAKILSPDKIVLHPDKTAGCPMADMITPAQILELKKKYPKAAVASYVNSNADVKALSDVCVTSSNAVKIINNLPQQEIIFVPDKNLASYVQSKTNKNIIPWTGFCCVHEKITPESVLKAKENYPQAQVLVHPECRPEVVRLADAVCSTSQMIDYARESKAMEFIVVTEEGMCNRLSREIPNKKFYPLGQVCIQMKKINLKSVLDALNENIYKVELSDEMMMKAKRALVEMLEKAK